MAQVAIERKRTADRFGMFREPRHEGKTINDVKLRPFVLSAVQGLLR